MNTPTKSPQTQGTTITIMRSWKMAALEVGAIIFSVIFALMLSEWWQGLEERAHHTRVLELIQSELASNRDELAESITYYERMIESLRPLMSNDSVTQQELLAIEGCCNMGLGGNNRNAYETGAHIGLFTALDPELSNTIVAPYVGGQALAPMKEISLQSMLASDLTDTKRRISSYFIFVSVMTPAEQEIVDLIDEALLGVEAELQKRQ